MYVQTWHAQNKSGGAIGQTLEGISSLLKLNGYSQFRAAVAYATLSGCTILNHAASDSTDWASSRKRWLISIDFGRTEPAALEFLAKLPHSQVRIPDGLNVVASPKFSPSIPFHPKAYAVDDISDGGTSVFGIFLGSGNLTGSGLVTGSECGVLSRWSDPSSKQKTFMMTAYSHTMWFGPAWERADPLADVIAKYKALWKKFKPPFTDESPGLLDLFIGGPDKVTAGNAAVALALAEALWVEIGELYKNRGKSEAGNQVDLPRGTRVFFGFSPNTVTKNTIFGHVLFQNDGFAPAECSIRFGNNMMDKANLPIPTTQGPNSYDNSILLFERAGFSTDGMPRFRIQVGDESLLKKHKKASASHIDMKMQSGRRYGLLF